MKITIVVPFKNRAAMLQKTLQSLECLAGKDMRLLLVDNGSDAATHDVCKAWVEEWKEKDMMVDMLEEKRPGAPCARNCGLAACETEWVYFFDSDDELDARFPDYAILAEADDDTDMCFIPVRQENGGHVHVRAYLEVNDPHVQIMSGMMSTHSMIFRTDFLRRIGGWNEDAQVWQDWELGLRALLHKPKVMWLTDRSFHTIHIHADSITGKDFSASLQRTLHTMDIAYDDVEKMAEGDTQRRCRTALAYRAAIMRGKLRKCGDEKAAKAYAEWSRAHCSMTLAAHWLYLYTRMGGRGAWRLALHF